MIDDSMDEQRTRPASAPRRSAPRAWIICARTTRNCRVRRLGLLFSFDVARAFGEFAELDVSRLLFLQRFRQQLHRLRQAQLFADRARLP